MSAERHARLSKIGNHQDRSLMMRRPKQHRSLRWGLRWLQGGLVLWLCLLLTQCAEPLLTPCQGDADCAEGKVCIAAGCVDKPASCPARCVKHDDCTPCASDKRFCINGVCSPLPPACPTRCDNDAECRPCGENKTRCLENQCTRAPDCPADCTQDKDCAGCGDQICFRQKCTLKASSCPQGCNIDRDCTGCKEGFRSCIGGFCSDEKAGCENDSQCSNGEKCIWKQCTKDQIVGRKCSGACPVGYLCLYGYCFQECTNKPALCDSNDADGRVHCAAFSLADRGRVSVCIGLVEAGKLCEYASFNTPRQAFCKQSLSAPTFCNDEGVCQEALVQREEGAPCHKRGETRSPGEVLKVCDQLGDQPLGCDNNQTKGVCVKATKAKVGMRCDETGLALGTPTLCDGSSVCIGIYTPYLEGRCFETCATDGSFPCADKRFRCFPYSWDRGKGICLQAGCKTDDDCGFEGYVCRLEPSGAQLCVPPVPQGTQRFGQLCGAKACREGLECLPSSNSGAGFCTKACATQRTCPTVTSDGTVFKSVCFAVGADGAQQRCLIQCQDQRCPEGLNCFEVAGRNNQKNYLCLPPS